MPEALKFSQAFKWSDNGYTVLEFQAGDVAHVSVECAQTAIEAGVAAPMSADEVSAAITAHKELQAAAVKARAQATKAASKFVELEAEAEAAEAAVQASRAGNLLEAEAPQA